MGTAKLRQASQATATTISRGATGTLPYMAPEMFSRGHRGTAVDIHALGCLFIELFGQRRVWPGLDGMQIMQKVCGAFQQAPVMPSSNHILSRYLRWPWRSPLATVPSAPRECSLTPRDCSLTHRDGSLATVP